MDIISAHLACRRCSCTIIEYADFNDFAPDSGVKGFFTMKWTPGRRQPREETATIVGLLRSLTFQIVSTRSDDAAPSQSMTTRSVLPFSSWAEAFDELRQTCV